MDFGKESQVYKFKEPANCIDSLNYEKRWDAQQKKVVKHKPVEKPV
jgi:hypothetical protein